MKDSPGKVKAKAHKESDEGYGVLITRRSDGKRFFALGAEGRFFTYDFGTAATRAKELRKHLSSPLRVARMRMTCELITELTPRSKRKAK